MFPIINKDEVNEEIIKVVSGDYIYPKKSRNGKVQFKPFAHTLGSTSLANISTSIGFVKIKVRSQFEKMLFSRDNRSALINCIKNTLKKPLFIVKDKDDRENKGYYFVSAFNKKNGNLFYMTSICKKINEKENKENKSSLVLMTSYQIRNLGKFKSFLNNKKILFVNKDLTKIIEINKKIAIYEERELGDISLKNFNDFKKDKSLNNIKVKDKIKKKEHIISAPLQMSLSY